MRVELRWPRPLAVAEEVPPEDAGGTPLFFFGTLMDREILAHLLARPVRPEELRPAVLAGFRRVAARNASYPVLLPDPAGRVEGVLFRAGPGDLRRINHYECDEYRAERHEIRTADGETMAAWIFLGRETVMQAGEEPWDLDAWIARHKPGFFARIDEWMEDLPPDEPDSGGDG